MNILFKKTKGNIFYKPICKYLTTVDNYMNCSIATIKDLDISLIGFVTAKSKSIDLNKLKHENRLYINSFDNWFSYRLDLHSNIRKAFYEVFVDYEILPSLVHCQAKVQCCEARLNLKRYLTTRPDDTDGKQFGTTLQSPLHEGQLAIKLVQEYMENGELAEYINFTPNPSVTGATMDFTALRGFDGNLYGIDELCSGAWD